MKDTVYIYGPIACTLDAIYFYLNNPIKNTDTQHNCIGDQSFFIVCIFIQLLSYTII